MTFRGVRKVLIGESLALMGIPTQYLYATWKDYEFPNESLKKLLTGYTDHCDAMFDDNVGLLLYGSNGVGKTYISSIILKMCYAHYYSCRMVTFKELISKTFKNEDTSAYYDTEFLVIDELGAEVSLKSDAEKCLLEELLKARFTKGLPTIICSNLDLDALKRRYGNTFYSMLSEFVKVKIVSEDGRKTAFRKKDALKFLK